MFWWKIKVSLTRSRSELPATIPPVLSYSRHLPKSCDGQKEREGSRQITRERERERKMEKDKFVALSLDALF